MKKNIFCLLLCNVLIYNAYAQQTPYGDTELDFNLSTNNRSSKQEHRSEENINRKLKEIKQLTGNALLYFKKNKIDRVCDDFIHKSIWRKGELFVFVFKVIEGQKGKKGAICLTYGDDTGFIWTDISKFPGTGGMSLIDEMLTYNPKGSMISFLWNGGYQTAYIRRVEKDGATYILGSGFYPESDKFTTKQIVKTAVAYLKHHGPRTTFALINNPNGPFVKGDIYTFAYDFNGLTVARGQNAALIGQNVIDQVDSRGKPLVKDIIKVAKHKGKGWVDYYWRNAFKRSYVERVVDPKTKKAYIISAGYYPNINLEAVKTYVHKAIKHLKSSGSKIAFADFSNQIGEFTKGGLTIFVYDLHGKALAHGENPSFVGQNLLKRTDSEGHYFVKELIDVARKYGKGLIQYRDKNATAVDYVELVDTPDGKFIIGSKYYPASKSQTVQAMVNRAVEHIKENITEKAFSDFTTRESDFYRGDLHIFVYGSDGTRYANGIQTNQIWRNFTKTTDQEGKEIVGDIIATAINGGGWIEYKARNATRRVYVQSVEKQKSSGDTEVLTVGSGYFL